MIFQREGCKPVSNPTAKQIARELSLMKRSFASLTADNGSYVQAAGGPGLFALEYRDASKNQFRAKQANAVVPFVDGTILSFSGSNLKLAQAEWFLLKQFVEAFTAFLAGERFPADFTWQRLTDGFIVATDSGENAAPAER